MIIGVALASASLPSSGRKTPFPARSWRVIMIAGTIGSARLENGDGLTRTRNETEGDARMQASRSHKGGRVRTTLSLRFEDRKYILLYTLHAAKTLTRNYKHFLFSRTSNTSYKISFINSIFFNEMSSTVLSL